MITVTITHDDDDGDGDDDDDNGDNYNDDDYGDDDDDDDNGDNYNDDDDGDNYNDDDDGDDDDGGCRSVVLRVSMLARSSTLSNCQSSLIASWAPLSRWAGQQCLLDFRSYFSSPLTYLLLAHDKYNLVAVW